MQPEPPAAQDPEEAARLVRIEAETEAVAQAERDAMLMRMAPYIVMAALFLLFLLSPLVKIWLGVWVMPSTSKGIAWLCVEAPLLVLAALVFRRGRLKLPGGKVYQGWKVRAGAVLAVVVSFLVFSVRFWGVG